MLLTFCYSFYWPNIEGWSFSVISTSCIFGSSTLASKCWQWCSQAKNCSPCTRQAFQRW